MISIFNVSGNLLTMLQDAMNQAGKGRKLFFFTRVAPGVGTIYVKKEEEHFPRISG
jgi:hypothetical protein